MTNPIGDDFFSIMPPGSCLIVSDPSDPITLCKPSDLAGSSYESNPPSKLKVIHRGDSTDWQKKAQLWRESKETTKPDLIETEQANLTPPKSKMARLLYEVATQLDNLEIKINVKLPVEGLSDKKSRHTFDLNALIKNKGALVYLGSSIHPALTLPLWEPGTKIPIFSPFFKIRLMKLSLDEDRHITARVCYLIIPFNYDAHDKAINALKKGGVPQDILKSQGYDWNESVPLYTWDILDTLLEYADKKMDRENNPLLPNKIKPLWDEGTVSITGNFDNETINLPHFSLNFAPKNKKHKQRIVLKGMLTNPTLALFGLSDITFGTKSGFLHFSNNEPYNYPWIIKTKWDPTGSKKPVFTIDEFKSNSIYFETKPLDGLGKNARLSMQEGIEMSDIKVDLNETPPALTIKKIVGKQIGIEGFGTKLQTEAGNLALIENLYLTMDTQNPQFEADIKSKAKGEISYFMNKEELGHMSFDFLDEASGHISIKPDEKQQTKVQIKGRIKTLLPNLRLLVRSEKMHAFVKTQVDNAKVEGDGTLSIWPQSSQIEIKANQNKPSIRVAGSAGIVSFGQRAYQIEQWKEELLQYLPPELLTEATTDIQLALKNITFDIQKMKLKSVVANSDSKPAFQIEDTIMGPINVEGILTRGLFFFRLPTGLYVPWDLTHDWNLNSENKPRKKKEAPLDAPPNILIKLDLLTDKTSHDTDESDRKINFENIELIIEELTDTFSKRDAQRCGATKQHIHAKLKNFFFTPNEREFTFSGIEHLHAILKLPFIKGRKGSSGCIVID